MTIQDGRPNVQAFRRVYEHGHSINSTSTSGEIICIVCHPDASSGRDILLWDDILAVFKTALYVRSGTVALPFLKGPDFKNLDPLRFAAVPGVTLDIVVKWQPSDKELSAESPQESSPDASHANGSNIISSATALNSTPATTVKRNSVSSLVEIAWENHMYIDDTPPTVRRNPAGGLVEVAMDAYRNNDNPAFSPRPRGPQAILDDPSPPLVSDTPLPSQHPVTRSHTLVPKEPISAASKEFDEGTEKAESGDMDAQFALGEKYYLAQGVPQDYSAALGWYLKAARQGHKQAQNMTGYMNQHGQGTPQDYAAAMNWFLKSANQGHAAAQTNIGWLYEHGLGVPQDFSSAMDWYLKAAHQGSTNAQNSIALLYRHGHGVPQDYSLAMEWYLKAAEQGDSVAQSDIGWLYQSGHGVPRDYSKAMSWYRKSADQGNAIAQNNIAWMYEQGFGVSKDRTKAIKWYRKAVDGGDAEAKAYLDRLEQQSNDETKRGVFKRLFK